MNALIKITLLGCLIVAGSTHAASEQAATSQAAQPASRSDHNITRKPIRILVTFHDERVGRVPVGDPVDSYRPRGNYRNSTWSEQIADQLTRRYGIRQVAQWPITTLGIHCVVYEVPQDRSTEQVLDELRRDDRVEGAQAMQQFRTMATGYSDPYFKLQAGLRSMNIAEVHRIATGRNVTVAVIDTGIDDRHPDLVGQLSKEENFVAESTQTTDDIHGTAVAGIIAASANNGRGIVGVAPNAKLIALKACWQESPRQPEASCNTFTLALALNTAIQLKPQVLNMSLTGPKDPLLERLIRKAHEVGIIVVASEAAKPDVDDDFPASMPQVIAVRSASAANADPAVSSAHTVAAPGVEVLTTLPHDTYNFMTGSSFAAANVSGLIALLLELRRDLTTTQVLSILNGASPIPTGNDGIRSIDACLAVAKVAGVSTCSSVGLNAAGEGQMLSAL